MTPQGSITKEEDGTFVVQVPGSTHLLSQPGVTCENPDAPENQRIYTKRFVNKRIYLPHEYERAVQEILRGDDVLVLGANGYSELSEAKCKAWGVQPGAYEAACEGILHATYRNLTQKFDGIDVRFAHGASAMGIDKVIIKVAKFFNRPQLGHSCPKFMFYVEDGDGIPVYCAENSDAYAQTFIESLHVLLAMNGRAQAFEHDIDAVFKKLKHLIPVNVLKSISTNGGPPAIGPDGKIEDAVAAFEQRIHMIGQQISAASRDHYSSLVAHICDVSTLIARRSLSPTRAFNSKSL